MLIGGGHVLPIVRDYRLVWISGRYGAGKTLLALELAEAYLQQGYRLLTNIPCVWADEWEDVKLQDDGRLRAVVVMDEAGLTLKYLDQLELMCSYSRKMDLIFIFPSFMPPVRYAQVVNLHGMYSLYHLLIPVEVWSCRIRLGTFKETTSFVHTGGEKIYGIYSTQATDRGTEDLIQYLSEKVEEFRKYHDGKGYSKGAATKQLRTVALRPRDETAAALRDLAGSMEEAADNFSSVPARTRRR